MNVLGLFSGIGGFELGFQRAGCTIAAMCEIDPYCRAVLRKHWPDVPCYEDVKTLTGATLAKAGITVDVITGGFPCQDISLAGKGAGIGGERSGLWSEYARLIGEIRPTWVVIENVSALRYRGLDTVLGSLATLGYDAEWHCIPASAVGAPHRRDRVWVVAHARCLNSVRRGGECGESEDARACDRSARPSEHTFDVAHAHDARLEGWLRAELSERARERAAWADGACVPNPPSYRRETEGERSEAGHADRLCELHREKTESDWWLVEPDVGRVAHGVRNRVDRLRALGNAVVPQIPEMIARAILSSRA